VVVAGLVNGQYPVPTYPLTNARLIRLWTQIVGFDLAGGTATIVKRITRIHFLPRGYSVIAGLAVVHNTVAAILEIALGVASIRGVDTTGRRTSAAAGARVLPAPSSFSPSTSGVAALSGVFDLGGAAVRSREQSNCTRQD
jgi:hypothetical protein